MFCSEMFNRVQVEQLVGWCKDNNLSLNVNNTKFLGVHNTKISLVNTTYLAKKEQKRVHFLKRLKQVKTPPAILTTFYFGTVDRVLTS